MLGTGAGGVGVTVKLHTGLAVADVAARSVAASMMAQWMRRNNGRRRLNTTNVFICGSFPSNGADLRGAGWALTRVEDQITKLPYVFQPNRVANSQCAC